MQRRNGTKGNYIIKRGDIFTVDFGLTSGSEQGGMRPCIIISNDVGNRFSPTVMIAMISSKINKCKLPTHVMLDAQIGLDRDSYVMLEQIRTIDKSRLMQFRCRVDKKIMNKIERALQISAGLLNTREEGILKQLEEVKYQERALREVKEDVLSSIDQKIQRKIRFDYEYRKLKKICEEAGTYVEKYYILNEIEINEKTIVMDMGNNVIAI